LSHTLTYSNTLSHTLAHSHAHAYILAHSHTPSRNLSHSLTLSINWIMSGSVTKYQDAILTVRSPLLAKTLSSTFVSHLCAGDSSWVVTLTLETLTLTASVKWYRERHQDLTGYETMFIVPHCSPRASIAQFPVDPDRLRAGRAVACSFNADKVTVQEQYMFDIVFSSHSDKDNVHPYSYVKTNGMATSTPNTNNKNVALTLLRDPASVDVAFMFEDEKAFNGVGLWAHSAVLSTHRVFEELIQHDKEISLSAIRTFGSDMQDEPKNVKEAKVGSDSDSLYTLADGGTTLAYSSAQASTPTAAAAASVIDPSAAALYERVVFITLKNVSLTTMCALLYYIYTNGVLDLSVKLGRFAISRCDLGNANGKRATRMVWCDTEGRFDASRDWHPLENHSPWKLKDVTWSELWEASTLFRITDLQTLCRDGVIDGIDESNAVDVLFSKAAVDVDIKNAAMAKVVQNMGSILAKAEDPFAPYRHHPDYHDILIQLMRLKAKND
ncbi:MAG: hypothetical protein J3R72DRAFT_500971, partial [Linnemannia gamsii]